MSEKKRFRFVCNMTCLFLFLAIVYILSIGPVFAKVMHLTRDALDSGKVDPVFSSENFDAFYAPLKWVAKKNLFIEDLLYDYMFFCSDWIYPEDSQEYFELPKRN